MFKYLLNKLLVVKAKITVTIPTTKIYLYLRIKTKVILRAIIYDTAEILEAAFTINQNEIAITKNIIPRTNLKSVSPNILLKLSFVAKNKATNIGEVKII